MKKLSQLPFYVDIIILSYAKNAALRKLTEQTIDSLLKSENPNEIEFNIVVIESNKNIKPYQFAHSTTLYPDADFGFNRYLNIDIKAATNKYICFCNNDLIFHENWASEILNAMQKDPEIASASTYCKKAHRNFTMNSKPIEGYENLFSGWCFMIKKSLVERIGYFDEKFIFWYADIDFLKVLKAHNLKNKLITKALVTHLNSVTTAQLGKKDHFNFTTLPILYFNYKWGKDNFFSYRLKTLYFYLRYFL